MTISPEPAACPAPMALRPAPLREPPFDDELPGRRIAQVGRGDQPLPFAPAGYAPTTQPAPPWPMPRRRDLPEPAPFARRFVIAVIEAATGRRSPGQLSRHTSPGVQNGLAKDAGRIGRLGTAARPATLRSLHVAEPADGVVEAAAVVRVGARFRAIAFRLESLDGRWRCVRLQIG